jgi:hypothetical protein
MYGQNRNAFGVALKSTTQDELVGISYQHTDAISGRARPTEGDTAIRTRRTVGYNLVDV